MIEQSIENEILSNEVPNNGEVVSVAEERSVSFDWSRIKDLIMIETGKGEIEDYINSPLNFDKSEGLGQILRGLSGILGSDILRMALLDIIIGAMKWGRKFKAGIGNAA